ncbi:DUF5777 family beta-barrel protein [Winogradskyella immobilis]|uniref:DUF5777 domain-containing protein n=1 Tax=Winogradskyella immobilis TaxID=2816852 RepID=A0ABS8EKG5_9FLAO|nr:DUF5777 family beta-barrel protein [Winogradskyella immobilis]MCC1483512.1 hypothetical protein [Winogradskyella immobilis]MCG0015606.1 DUF5777 family beta-barrel protein [Winogradskyella immobilis]
MKNKSKLIVFSFFIASIYNIGAQSLLDKLKAEPIDTTFYTEATFKGTRVGVGHSVETRKKNSLEISVMNRFWNLSREEETETSNSFIADRMSSRFGIDYSFTDRLTYGVGFSTLNNVLDNYVKYRLIRQQDNGPNKFSLTAFQSATHRSIPGNTNANFNDRLSFTTQLLFARKFTRNFSLQISPTYIHRSTVSSDLDDNNQFAVGFAARYKLKGHTSIFSEYFYVANELNSVETFGVFSLGVNWELSDLLLQFKMTNTGNFVEDAFITQTRRNFNFEDGNFFFGFHATYFIQL